MSWLRLLGIWVLLGLAVCVQGQRSTVPPAFDVATIRPSDMSRVGGEGSRWERVEHFPTSLTIRNASLSYCIQWAYGVKFHQISGPAWLASERFDIFAKTDVPATESQSRAMLQTLLADRFKLTMHRETKELPVYDLVVGKDGPRLPNAKGEGKSDLRVVDGSFVFQHTSMPEFAGKLSSFVAVDRPVFDKTGLTGVYDFTLTLAARAMLQDDGLSLFSIVQKEVGLRLEPRKRALEILVVDHAEKVPVGN